MVIISELIRSIGGNPEEELIKRIFSQTHRTYQTRKTNITSSAKSSRRALNAQRRTAKPQTKGVE